MPDEIVDCLASLIAEGFGSTTAEIDALWLRRRLQEAGFVIVPATAALLEKGKQDGITLTDACTHEHWRSAVHGRRCTCGELMWDAGD